MDKSIIAKEVLWPSVSLGGLLLFKVVVIKVVYIIQEFKLKI